MTETPPTDTTAILQQLALNVTSLVEGQQRVIQDVGQIKRLQHGLGTHLDAFGKRLTERRD